MSPAAAQRWTDQTQVDLPGALQLERRLQRSFADYITPFIERDGYSSAACDRLLARIGGWCDVGERMRWPYRAIPAGDAERLRPLARGLIPEFFGD